MKIVKWKAVEDKNIPMIPKYPTDYNANCKKKKSTFKKETELAVTTLSEWPNTVKLKEPEITSDATDYNMKYIISFMIYPCWRCLI